MELTGLTPPFRKRIADQLSREELTLLKSYKPQTREEFLDLMNLIYNLKVHPEFPHQLFLEVTNACNYACAMCPRARQSRPQGLLKAEAAETLIAECAANGLYWLGLFMHGEPLLYQDLARLVRYAKARGIKIVNVTTNGYLLDEGRATELIRSGLDTLAISLGGLNQADYRQMYGPTSERGDEYERVAENVKRLFELRKALPSRTPFIRIIAKFAPRTAPEKLAEFKRRFAAVTDDIEIGEPHAFAAGNDYVGYAPPSGAGPRIPCRKMWRQAVVLCNGDLSLCCFDTDGKTAYGNALQSGIKTVWNSPRRRELESRHIFGDYAQLPLCANCANGWW